MITKLQKPILALFFFITVFIVLIFTSNNACILSSISLDTYIYPSKMMYTSTINPILENLDINDTINDMNIFIESLPSERYYKSENGYQSAMFVVKYLENLIDANKLDTSIFEIETVTHQNWKQPSILFKLNGETDDIVVIGCHIDSINFINFNEAPGVDDNLSGVVTVIQTIKQLIKYYNDTGKSFRSSIEFHFYAAEEVGSIGSTQVFKKYRENGKKVIAMLQQDMTGYVAKSIDNGYPEHFGLITDYSSSSLLQFTKLVIDNYCDIPYYETECNKLCSDHISALMNSYPGVYALESKVDLSNPFIHTNRDTIDKLDFNHILQHIKLTISFTVELGMATDIRLDSTGSDSMSFKYVDFMILLMMHETKRFVYTVISFALCVGSIYVIWIDTRANINTGPSTAVTRNPNSSSKKLKD